MAETTSSTTVRVSTATHARLRKLAEDRRVAIDQMIADALEAYEEQEFWRLHDAWIDKMRDRPAEWAGHLAAATALQQHTPADGLEPEEWTDADFITPPAAR